MGCVRHVSRIVLSLGILAMFSGAPAAAVIGRAVVTADQAPVMSGKQVIATAKKGDTFDVTELKGDWFGVAPSQGWIHKSNVRYEASLTLGTANPKESSAGAQTSKWSLGEVSVSKKFGLWNNAYPFEENMGAAIFTVKPDAGEELVSVRFSISALAADTEAVAKLAGRRETLAETVPVFGKLLLIGPKQKVALTGAYRMFDMQDLVLIIRNIERSPRWVVEPHASGYFVGSGSISTGGWECSAPWHLANRTSTSFTGLLEVGKPATITLLFSVPKGADIKAALLRIVGQDSVPVKVSDNNYEVRK